MQRIAIHVAVLVLHLAALAVADRCPLLKTAVKTTPDYNHSSLTIQWFTQRGLHRDGLYGCMTPDASETGPYHLALGCSCDAWATCHSKNLDYSTRFDDRYSSRMGECRCCSWWVIFLICVGALGLVALATQAPRLKRWIKRKWRARKRAQRTELAALEDGDGREFTALGAHTELNNSAQDRKHSQLKSRRGQAGSIRRKGMQSTPEDSAPPLTRDATLPGGASGGSPLRAPAGSPHPTGGRPTWTDIDASNAYVVNTRAHLDERETPPGDESLTARTPAGDLSPTALEFADASLGSRPDAMADMDDLDTR